jgi:hypothetical protein
VVYFIQGVEGGLIKIGHTIQLVVRFKQLEDETGRKLTVLGILEGNRVKERELHVLFADDRVEGEWFRPSEALLTLIREQAQPWDGTDEEPMRSLIALKGTDEFEVWLDGLVERTRFGTRSLLMKNAIREYAERHDFKKPMPKR